MLCEVNTIHVIQMNLCRVLILVLMEYALRETLNQAIKEAIKVLILVLMEYALREELI